MKKPTLPRPPRGLSVEGRRFWRDMMDSYAILDVAGQKYLHRACRALDRLHKAEEELEAGGEVVKDRKGSIKRSPWVLIQRDAQRQFLEAMKALRVDVPGHEEG